MTRATRAVGNTISALPSAENNRAIAIAVLRAIRDPSDAMLYAGSMGENVCGEVISLDHLATTQLWQAMLDAAIGEE